MMSRLLLVVACLVALSWGAPQRPFYAPSPVGFGHRNTFEATTAAPVAAAGEVAQRFGGASSGSGTTASTEPLPIDARGDQELINMISQWPRERQPFWYINHKIIEASRNVPQPQPQPQPQAG